LSTRALSKPFPPFTVRGVCPGEQGVVAEPTHHVVGTPACQLVSPELPSRGVVALASGHVLDVRHHVVALAGLSVVGQAVQVTRTGFSRMA